MIAARLRLDQVGAQDDKALGSVRILTGVVLIAFAISIAARGVIGLNDPLWLDETWTGAFAAQPNLAALTDQVRNDVNAPLYYFVIFAWAKLFGLSNLALRTPSLLFSLATPVVAWLSLRRTQPILALVWAALLALWVPGIVLSGFARCYSLLILAVVANAWAFMRVLETPDLKRAALWVASAALAVLAHYHAAFLALAEAAVFVAMQPRRALRLWPAALVAAPALAWIAYHAPRLIDFARPNVAWYDRLTLADLPGTLTFLLGSTFGLPLAALAILYGWALSVTGKRDAAPQPAPVDLRPVWLFVLASVLAALACLTVAVIRPSFTMRYLTPFAPGVLLLVAAAIARFAKGRWEPQALVVAGFGALVLLWIGQAAPGDRMYSFERASAWLQETPHDRVVFFWDHPATPMEVPRQLDQVGGFFMRRNGAPTTVVPLFPTPGADVSQAALSAAGPHGEILWFYDTRVHGARAKTNPPHIAALDPSFTCRDFGSGPVGILACRKGAST